MKRHNFAYFVQEGLANVFSHGFMSFAAIGITVACLVIMGTFTLVAVNADALLKDLEEDTEILAFVDESLDDAAARALKATLEKVPNVTSATFITKEQAMDAYVEGFPEEPMMQDLDSEILRHRYAIRFADLQLTGATANALREVPGIARVNSYEEVSNGFIAVRNVASVVCAALIAVLFLVSMFIISNTIKLTTFDRREEIAIMRMVGATNSFIRWPFVYEGFLLGILSALLAFFLQWLLYGGVAQSVMESDTMKMLSIIPFGDIWKPVAGVFVGAGVLIGVGGSLSAIRRFLQV